MLTVIVPVYNNAATIERALNSLVGQVPELEVVVVDDCSTDDVVARVEALATRFPHPVTILRQAANQGPAAARNRGIEAARGDWIGLLDGDDAWLPGRWAALGPPGGDIDMIADQLTAYDAVADLATGDFYPDLQPGRLTLSEALTHKRGGRRFDCGYLKPLVRRDFVMRTGTRYVPDLRHGEDYVFYVSVLSRGARFHLSERPGYLYTSPVGQASGSRSPHSRTRPSGVRIARALKDLLAARTPDLTPDDIAAWQARIDTIEGQADIWLLHDAIARRDVVEVARLAARDRNVRNELADVFARKLRLKPA